MNTINRNYYPVSGLSTQGVNPESDSLQQPGVTSGHDSKLIDFSPPQQATGLQSSLNGLGSRAQTPTTSASSGTSENPVALLLNKLVEAIRNILKELFSGSSRNQQNASTPPPAQTQREQAPPAPQSSSTTPA
ncbi:type III helper protein HopAK1, partial [Pseudomonas syringae]|nr:type III helper protein HopAK1 [Pseudomonas syringae]